MFRIEKFRESLQSTETEEQSMQVDEVKTDKTATDENIKLESTDAGEENGAEINSDSFVVQEKCDGTNT